MTREEALENKIRVQKETEEAWFLSGCVGTAELATGSGKSKIFLNILERLRTDWGIPPTEKAIQVLLVTPTEGMRDQDWPDEFKKWNVSMEGVKIICQASLSREKLEKYAFICLDEYHNNTTPALRKIEAVLDSHRPMILGLTATLPAKADWPKDEERVGLLKTLVPSIYKLTTDEAVELGLIADFEVHVIKFKLDSKNLSIKAGSPKSPFMTTEASQYIYLTKNLQKAMYSKNEGLKFMAMQARTQFIYNLPSKTRLAKACMEKLQSRSKRTLVMAGSISQANELCGDAVYHSESTQTYLDKFQAGEIDLLGAVKSLDEGKNLFQLEQLLITQVQATERRLVQRLGRVLRQDYNNMDRKATIVILVAYSPDGKCCDEQWYNSAIKGFDSKRIRETYLNEV